MSMIAMACMSIANDGQFPAMRASSLRVPNSGSLALLYKLDCQANGLLASPGVFNVPRVSTVFSGVTIVTRSSQAWRLQSVLLIPSHSKLQVKCLRRKHSLLVFLDEHLLKSAVFHRKSRQMWLESPHSDLRAIDANQQRHHVCLSRSQWPGAFVNMEIAGFRSHLREVYCLVQIFH